MGPADVTSRAAVMRAIREYDELGQDAFLAKYGFKRSTRYVVIHNGREYDSKALLAAAHGFQYPDNGPLHSDEFSGGSQTTSRLQSLGFNVASVAATASRISFQVEDCELFERYPQRIRWDSENVNTRDQRHFRDLRERLNELATWLAENAQMSVPLKPFASRYQTHGFTQKDAWSCVYPAIVPNKSYSLQVAMLISANGAELCICLGAGKSALPPLQIEEAERALQMLRSRLATVPRNILDMITDSLPKEVFYRSSWRQEPPGVSEFENLDDWTNYAASLSGAQASISLYIDPVSLARLGSSICDLLLHVANAAAPLMDYCYSGQADDLAAPNSRAKLVNDSDDLTAVDSEVGVEVDSLGHSIGVERESLSEEAIEEPFDPEKIDVATRNPTVDLLLARIRRGVLDLQPEFQRMAGIWSQQNQSRLIESMLLRIPLPTFYAAEAFDEDWIIVDGVQRLTTIARFIDPESIDARPLSLSKLEYLRQYEGKQFSDLPGRLQTRLVETELVLHLIRRGTPEPVMFNIFARINTGGRPLTRQELRHALIPGRARTLLREMAESLEFQTATLETVSPERMDDREMVLRFMAFRLHGAEEYGPDFDEFLRAAMHEINDLSDARIDFLRRDFARAMDAAHIILGPRAFRKYDQIHQRRSPINKALFEATSVNLAKRSDSDLGMLLSRQPQVLKSLSRLQEQPDFERSISVGTGDIGKVRLRFAAIDNLFAEMTYA